ncbi:MAG: short-chain dehydrogenase/reductase [Blastococcus sp.]|jgi:3-oxoacyl-[acyl-carrier protein] reductase|nr:short-chain dehydrogenase/reductase [Blastococcus sp.]
MTAIDWSAVRLPGLDSDRVVAVTGAGGEMGGGTARALLAMGVKTVALGRSLESLEATIAASAAPENGLALVCDIADQGSIERALATAYERFGRLDAVINCAAVGDGSTPADQVTSELAHAVMEVDFFGPLLLSQVAATYMRRNGGGSIVFVSSVAAHRVMPGGSMYGAAKVAVTRLARSLATEWGPDGIRVNVMSPGQTPTLLKTVGVLPESPDRHRAGASSMQVPLRRRGETDDYVGAMLFLISDLAQYVTGQDVLVEGGVVWPRVAAS